MHLDLSELPLIWMRNHTKDEEHDDENEGEILLGVLRRNEPFIMIAEEMPRLSDIAAMDQAERKERAKLFKVHKKDLARLCAGMIVIAPSGSVAMPVRVTLEKFASAIGITLLFADSPPAAREIAQARLSPGLRP